MEEEAVERRDHQQQNTPAIAGESGLQYILEKGNFLLVAFLTIGMVTVACAVVAIVYAVAEHYWTFADVAEEPLVITSLNSRVAHVALQKVTDEDLARTVFCFVNPSPALASPYAFYIENISTSLCDAVVYVSVGIDHSGTSLRSRNPQVDITAHGFKRFADLKKAGGPRLSAWICVGGNESDTAQFRRVVSSRKARLTFIRNAIDWLKEQTFDGAVIYWRFPDSEVKSNFSTFLNTLRVLLDKESLRTSVVIPWNLATRRQGYFVRSIFDRFEFVIVDSHRTIDPSLFPVTTCQSPMRAPFRARHHGQTGLTSILDDLSMEADHLLRKTVLSISLGGVSFTVKRSRIHRLGATAAGPGHPMGYTHRVGVVSYYDVIEMLLKNASWTRFFHAHTRCVVAYHQKQWVGFEDRDSIHTKGPLVRKTSGIAVWDLEMDDFAGDLGPSWPLLMEAHDIVHGQVNYALVTGTIVF